MTTDDFREKVESLGFNTYCCNNTISIERSGVVIAFTNDRNLADNVSRQTVEDVILLMDRIHNIEVKKERV